MVATSGRLCAGLCKVELNKVLFICVGGTYLYNLLELDLSASYFAHLCDWLVIIGCVNCLVPPPS